MSEKCHSIARPVTIGVERRLATLCLKGYRFVPIPLRRCLVRVTIAVFGDLKLFLFNHNVECTAKGGSRA